MATLTNNLNYLQPTSYKLRIDRENYPNLEYFAQSVTHPGMIMNPVEVPYKQLSGIPLTGAKLTYNELSANLILDENLSSYNEMYNWMRRLLEQEEIPAIKRSHKLKVVPTYSDITVSILSKRNKPVLTSSFTTILRSIFNVAFCTVCSNMEKNKDAPLPTVCCKLA